MLFLGKPDPVTNCSITNYSISSLLLVTCDAGFDGGLLQAFTMEVYNGRTGDLLLNVTNTYSEPRFKLEDPDPEMDLNIIISAMNVKGRSHRVELERIVKSKPRKQTGKGCYKHKNSLTNQN